MLYATSLLSRSSTAIAHVQAAQQRVLKAQNDIASGSTISVGSDDPVASGIALRMQAAKSRIDTYIDSIDIALSRQEAMDSALQEVDEALTQARSIAVSGASSATGSDESRNAQALEIDAIISRLATLANSSSVGGYLFGGTETDSAPFLLSGGTVTYRGTSTAKTIQISSTLSSELSIPGNEIFCSPHDVFARMTELRNALSSGDTDTVGGSIASIDSFISSVNGSLTRIGAASNSLETVRGIQDAIRIAISADRSNAADTDMAEASIRLTAATTAYEAALEVASRLAKPTLLDYL